MKRRHAGYHTLLVNAVGIMEKLMPRLEPWYVKYDKWIAVMVSMVGIVSGIVKVIDTLTKIK